MRFRNIRSRADDRSPFRWKGRGHEYTISPHDDLYRIELECRLDRAGCGDSNHIRIVAIGKEGKLYVNGHYVTNLQLQGLVEEGRVSAIANYNGTGIAGYSRRFEDFMVWPLAP